MDVVKGWSELAGRQSDARHSLTALRSRYKTLSDTITELTTAVQEMEELLSAKRVSKILSGE